MQFKKCIFSAYCSISLALCPFSSGGYVLQNGGAERHEDRPMSPTPPQKARTTRGTKSGKQPKWPLEPFTEYRKGNQRDWLHLTAITLYSQKISVAYSRYRSRPYSRDEASEKYKKACFPKMMSCTNCIKHSQTASERSLCNFRTTIPACMLAKEHEKISRGTE